MTIGLGCIFIISGISLLSNSKKWGGIGVLNHNMMRNVRGEVTTCQMTGEI
jgi:hypothetical protein